MGWARCGDAAGLLWEVGPQLECGVTGSREGAEGTWGEGVGDMLEVSALLMDQWAWRAGQGVVIVQGS